MSNRPGRGKKAGPDKHDPHRAAEQLGDVYASAKEAAECIERGMSVKEAVQQARTTAPGGHDVTPQQVVQGIHDLMSAGPDEEMDAAEDGDHRQGPATR